ncbi:MAG: geopeptide radical SAM maturase, partial [Desulfobulbaceae bacterium]|nr:geopeptide radical SAM maturase [Candidatus Desulfobia pelagia]
MPLSHYAHIFTWPADLGQRIVYSTRTGATALLPTETLDDISACRLDDESKNTLKELNLLVDDLQAERNEAMKMVRQINDLRRAINISVIVTMQCNFRCRYCYEGSQKGHDLMSEETTEQLVTFVKNKFTPDIERLTLDFYGGEPLLAAKRIEQIAGALKDFIESQGAMFEFTLVTNGSLLTLEMVQRLLPLGLKRAKITIDGPLENHNFFRPYKSGQPSFDTIVHNIKQICGLIQIGVSGNYTKDNFRQFPALFDHLETFNIGPKDLHRLTFAPVLQTKDEFSAGFCGGCASVNEKWLGEAVPFLRGEIMAKRLKTDAISVALCMVDVDNSCVIHHDGSLYKCVAMICHNEYACGDIRYGMYDYSQQYQLAHWQKEEKCRECTYLPLCLRGGRYMALPRDG